MTELIYFNREERFYTATVFPSIVCQDGFRHFPKLLSLLNELDPTIPIPETFHWTPGDQVVLFYSEYSLKKSGHHFVDEKDDGDTPDIVFLAKLQGSLHLFALEGKMYTACSGGDMTIQLARQLLILNKLAKQASVEPENIHHFGLVPATMANTFDAGLQRRMLTWENVLSAYKPILENDYFVHMLSLALERFDDLRSKIKKNNDDELTVQEIIDCHEKLGVTYIGRGREKGLTSGEGFRKDCEDGSWSNRKYQVAFGRDTRPNANWFSITEFLDIVNILSSK
jgi:hypothetical protein